MSESTRRTSFVRSSMFSILRRSSKEKSLSSRRGLKKVGFEDVAMVGGGPGKPGGPGSPEEL